MSYSLKWLPEVLKDAGLKVATIDGWETRGRGDVGNIVGVICHHTAGPKTGNMPSLHIVTEGRPATPRQRALAGPLAQLCLGRDGTFYVVAAGKTNHAGEGIWKGFTNGNANFIGIEAENAGTADDLWPQVQMDAYRRGVAAILAKIGQKEIMCAGHKEYALPNGRKPDPRFDMVAFRSSVAAIMQGIAPPPVFIPTIEPEDRSGGIGPRLTLRRGTKSELVKQMQEALHISADGDFGSKTEAAVRAFQRTQGIVPDGIVGPKTWAALDGKADALKYTIKAGDSLSKIATANGIGLAALLEANPTLKANPDRIIVGEEVVIPTRDTSLAHSSSLAPGASGLQSTEISPSSIPEELVNDSRIKAMLEVLAFTEGTGNDYGKIVNGTVIEAPNHSELIGQRNISVTDLSQHPNILVQVNSKIKSTAAGRYQFLKNTWDGLGMPDFSEQSQDIAAVKLMQRRKMIAPLLTSDLHTAVFRGAPEWASLPDENDKSHYGGQPAKSIAQIDEKYKENLLA